jgi:anti-sigma regulatory factor (Ser/Thr protein kinase)
MWDAEDVAWLTLDDVSAAGAARRASEQLADRLGFRPARGAEVGLAVTEIAANVHRHAGGGMLLLRAIRDGHRGGIEVVAMDLGPGMRDVTAARRDGFSTSGTLGIGLGAVSRLATHLDISSRPGRGTVLVARFHDDRLSGEASTQSGGVAGLTRALAGEAVCGDSYAVRADRDRCVLILCDGSGHGPLAAAAARDAVRKFNEVAGETVESILGHMHRTLLGTRGCAVAVAELDLSARRIRYGGIGNIAGAIVAAGQRSAEKRSMVSIGGVAGYRDPTVRVFDYALPIGSVVVMHSDGVRARWAGADLDGLLHHGPLVIAATVLRDAGTRHDDACVLVAKVAL